MLRGNMTGSGSGGGIVGKMGKKRPLHFAPCAAPTSCSVLLLVLSQLEFDPLKPYKFEAPAQYQLQLDIL